MCFVLPNRFFANNQEVVLKNHLSFKFMQNVRICFKINALLHCVKLLKTLILYLMMFRNYP